MEKSHIEEVDYIRVFGLISIVFVHAFGFSLLLPAANEYSRVFQELSINLFRFGRQIFMFVTGVVLFYNYGHRVNIGHFFNRRLKNLFIPYAVWTALYLLIDLWSELYTWPGLSGFVALWVSSLLSGNAFSHLYYIVVAMQFYLVFPFISSFRPRRPLPWVLGLFTGGVAICALYHYGLEIHGTQIQAVTGSLWGGFISWFMHYKDRLLISYLPYYLLGGMAGLYWESWRSWAERHRGLIAAGFAAAAGLVIWDYFYHYRYLGEPWHLIISVFKPSIYLYTLGLLTFVSMLAFVWAQRGYFSVPVKSLAANSLGIYLIHPAVLFLFHSFLVPYIPLPGSLLIIMDPVACIALSWQISKWLSMSRYARFLVGEAGGFHRGDLLAGREENYVKPGGMEGENQARSAPQLGRKSPFPSVISSSSRR